MTAPTEPDAPDVARPPDATQGIRKSSMSTLAPVGDVRLTVNLQSDLHLKLKIRAAQERSTMGELIEAWIRSW